MDGGGAAMTAPAAPHTRRSLEQANHGTRTAAPHVAYTLEPVRFPRPDVATVAAMLQVFTGPDVEQCEFGYIEGDPRYEPKRYPISADGRSLMFVRINGRDPQSLHAAATLYADLVARFGNVYVSIGLYRRKERTQPDALPRHVLFIDDGTAPDHLPPTLELQTSPTSKQLFYVLDQPVDLATYRELEAGLRAACNAPANSTNPLHLAGAGVSLPAFRHPRH